MKKFIAILTIVMVALAAFSCATTKTAQTQSDVYTVEEVTLYGYGVGKYEDENTARNMAMTAALGDLSVKLQAKVRTASSNYQKQTGTMNKTLFESLTEVVSENQLQGVTFIGDKKASDYTRGKYEYRIEARVNETILKKSVNAILDELDATADERDAYRREMFGDDNA